MQVNFSHFGKWLAIGSVTLVLGAVACGGNEPDADEYLSTIRSLSEQDEERNREIFATLDAAPPASLEFLGMLADALPEAIEQTEIQISELEELEPPEEFVDDHRALLGYLSATLDLQRRQLTAAVERDDLASRQLGVEAESLERNLLPSLSTKFRESLLVSDMAIAASSVFGNLTQAEAGYLDEVSRAYEEFRSRNARFGEILNRQFSDSQALLGALQDAGAGTAFEAVRDVLRTVEPPERFTADHALLLTYLDDAVRLDREIGQAIDDVDPVHFVVSNLELGNGPVTVATVMGLSQPVLEIAFPGQGAGIGGPSPETLDDPYLGPLSETFRAFVAGFGLMGPDYLAFNIGNEDAFEVIGRANPGYVATIENTMAEIRSLDAPETLAGEQDALVTFFEETLAAQNSIASAAAAGDMIGVTGGMLATRTAFCGMATDLLEADSPMLPAIIPGPAGISGLDRMCPGI